MTGRHILWAAGVDARKESPLWGVTREGLFDVAVEHLEESEWETDLKNGGIHTVYLTILTCSGIIGAVWYLIFMVASWKKLISLAWKRKCSVYMTLGIVFLLIFLIMDMMECRTMYQMNIFFVLFWMMYGYTMYMAEELDG